MRPTDPLPFDHIDWDARAAECDALLADLRTQAADILERMMQLRRVRDVIREQQAAVTDGT